MSDELAAIRERRSKITPGDWEYVGTEMGHEIRMGTAIADTGRHEPQHLIEYHHGLQPEDGDQWREASNNCEFFVAAPADIDTLMSLLAKRDAEIERSHVEVGELKASIDRLPFEALQRINVNPACGCHTCNPILGRVRMILCEVCGNKRCPHATNHRNDCTGSNAPGQPGSIFAASPAAATGEGERS